MGNAGPGTLDRIVAELDRLDEDGWQTLIAHAPTEAAQALDQLRRLVMEIDGEPGEPLSSAPGCASRDAESTQLHLRALYDVLPVGITLTDEQGRLVDCNPASERLLGIPREHHLRDDFSEGWTILDERGKLMPPEDYAGAQALRTGRAVHNQHMQVMTPNGRVWLSVNAVPIRKAGLGVAIAYTDISELVKARGQVEALSNYDVLTGLANRALFMSQLEERMQRRVESARTFSVILINLRGFSELNEAHGFEVGDRILERVARRLRSNLPRCLCAARSHADDFGVLIEGSATKAAEQAQQSIERPMTIGGIQITLGTYIGVAVHPSDAADAEALIKHAEIAQSRARKGRHTIRFYDPAMGEQVLRRLEIARHLDQAIDRDELQLAYQPQFDLKTGRVIGAEALLRWVDDQLGPVSPAEFIPVAEERGLMQKIGQWVLASACRQLRTWDRAGQNMPGRMAINISPSQLDDPDFVPRILSTLDDYDIPASRIELEITENAVASDPDRAMKVLARLGAEGLVLSIDDFGVGYSSLAALRRFRVDKLKIDGSFVHQMTEAESDRTIVRTIIAMTQSLGLTPLAEGVESEAQRAALIELGCAQAQGFLLGKPLFADDFAAAWLEEPQPKSP